MTPLPDSDDLIAGPPPLPRDDAQPPGAPQHAARSAGSAARGIESAARGIERPSCGSESPARVAVLIPCRNEAPTIAGVVDDFRRELPQAEIWVCDNASTDATAQIAGAAGAHVLREPRAGKGYSLRRLLNAVDADAYVVVDGDGTYDARRVHELLAPVLAHDLDMVVAIRVAAGQDDASASGVADAFPAGHRLGNRLFTATMSRLFDYPVRDVFSGYRALSRKFVRSFPSLSRGFEIETELTVHALDLGMPVGEVTSRYSGRPEGSASKLHTVRDGARIGAVLLHLYAQLRPARFFGAVGAALIVLSLALGLPVVVEFAQTGKVPRLPTAVLASALMLLAALATTCGVILDSVGRSRKEAKRLAYLAAVRCRSAG